MIFIFSSLVVIVKEQKDDGTTRICSDFDKGRTFSELHSQVAISDNLIFPAAIG